MARTIRGYSALAVLAFLSPCSPARADTVVTYTATNNAAYRAGIVYVRFDATDLHDLVVIDSPPLCPPPLFAGVYHDTARNEDEVYIGWACDCVSPGESVTFTVLTNSDIHPVSTYWVDDPGKNCPGVVVKSFHVLDLNGDQDGYPDTNETFELLIGVSNKWALDLANVVIRISTEDPKIDCILEPVVAVGDLPAGTDVDEAASFRLHVHPRADRGDPQVVCNNPGSGGTCSNFVAVSGGCLSDSDCRRTTIDDYDAEVTVAISADQLGVQTRPQTIALDLDLDSVQSSVPTTTFGEGFEVGFGIFTFQNLDSNLASNSASDGYRCQYNDPDFVNSNSYGDTECYLGFAAGQVPVNDWHVHTTSAPDGGRAFEGMRSLHYGKHTPGNPGADATGLSQMDGMRTKTNVNLAARVCSALQAGLTRSCNSAADCTNPASSCVSASPELSFKQQVSLLDGRCVRSGWDRAVVHAQLSGSALWEKIYPYENLYDEQGTDRFSTCMFDPIDDGNNEDSYFDPTDPDRRFGPSSTCYPEFVFSDLGDTDEPFDLANVGDASDGPGLPGSLGIGTWVESRFDLIRFRGRSIKIRYLFTSIKVGSCGTWGGCSGWSVPQACDDGWYIDDIRVTQTLGTASPTVTVDTGDNSALLPGNLDGDARGDECDCAPEDPRAFAVPGEVTELRLGQDKLTLGWKSAAPISGVDTVHDVVRGTLEELPVGGGPAEICLAPGILDATASDPASPAAEGGFWYLVRGRNLCGMGTYGFETSGIERRATVCP